MLSTKDMKNSIMQLFAESQNDPYVVGNGILIGMRVVFDEKKLEESKQTIATILQELGIDEHPMISLSTLTTLKNGEVWNQLQCLEDFQTLELLLACSDACGFIHNDAGTIQRNINEIGDINSLLISTYGRSMIGDDKKWLQSIREAVIGKMYFLTDSESIKLSANGNQELTEAPSHLHK